MPMTKAPAGVSLTTTLATIYTNPSNSGARETVRVRFSNIDGVNDADITNCNFRDAAPTGTFAILPKNCKCAVGDAIEITKVLEPGDFIQAQASASGDIMAVADVIFSEPV